MTLNNKILQLPSEQLSWLILIKQIFKRDFSTKNGSELIKAIEHRAVKKGYNEIGSMFNSNDLEKYFKN